MQHMTQQSGQSMGHRLPFWVCPCSTLDILGVPDSAIARSGLATLAEIARGDAMATIWYTWHGDLYWRVCHLCDFFRPTVAQCQICSDHAEAQRRRHEHNRRYASHDCVQPQDETDAHRQIGRPSHFRPATDSDVPSAAG